MLVPHYYRPLTKLPTSSRHPRGKAIRDHRSLFYLCCEQLQDAGWILGNHPALACSWDKKDMAGEIEVWRRDKGEVLIARFGVNFSHALRRPLRFFCCGASVVTGSYLTRNHLDKLHGRRSPEEHIKLATHEWFLPAAREYAAWEENLSQRRLFRNEAAAILLETMETRRLPPLRALRAYREYVHGAEQSAWKFLTIAGEHIQRSPPMHQFHSHHDMGWTVFSLLQLALTKIP